LLALDDFARDAHRPAAAAPRLPRALARLAAGWDARGDRPRSIERAARPAANHALARTRAPTELRLSDDEIAAKRAALDRYASQQTVIARAAVDTAASRAPNRAVLRVL
jgi:hypothetical protein